MRPWRGWMAAGLAAAMLLGGAAKAVAQSCDGVRPGALIETRYQGSGSFCTMNFVFRDRATKRRYVGTAGHCLLGEDSFDQEGGERSWRGRGGPRAFDRDERLIGNYAYAVLRGPKDFALIRLRRRVAANPAMCHWGGPTGINSDITEETVTLHFYGNGTGFGDVDPARSLTADGMPDRDEVYADGNFSPGDSGAGVISADGRAVGVGVAVSVGVGLDPADAVITRLRPQLKRARQVLDARLRMRTASYGR